MFKTASKHAYCKLPFCLGKLLAYSPGKINMSSPPLKHMIFNCTRARQLQEKAIVHCSFSSLLSWLQPKLFLEGKKKDKSMCKELGPGHHGWQSDIRVMERGMEGRKEECWSCRGGTKGWVVGVCWNSTQKREKVNNEKTPKTLFKKWCLKEVHEQKETKTERSPHKRHRC